MGHVFVTALGMYLGSRIACRTVKFENLRFRLGPNPTSIWIKFDHELGRVSIKYVYEV